MKYHVVTFGCQMNTADSEEMAGHLEAQGLKVASSLEEADLVLVNTCTVRQKAEHRALSLLGRLKEWKAAREGRLVVLTGCAAERIKDEVHWRLPQVDLTVGAKDIERFGERLGKLLKDRFDWTSETEEAFESDTVGPPILTFPPGGGKELDKNPIAYVTIMRGCNYTCSYCIVPSVRGKEVYRPLETILAEVKAGVGAGAKETLLLGQTVNSYRFNSHDFAGLLKEVDAVPGLKRVRYMSPHPHYMDKPTIDAMAELPSVCEHVHLPVQSGSDRVLKRMKRNYTRARYLEAVEYIRKKIPGVSITTDIIVGFPGETQDDLEQTLSLIQEADFDSAYCFKYSPRPGTESASRADDVPQQVKEERLSQVLELTEAQSKRNAKKLVGTTQEILVEEALNASRHSHESGNPALDSRLRGNDQLKEIVGRTRSNWQVKLMTSPNSKFSTGDLVPVKITSADGRSLKGEACAA